MVWRNIRAYMMNTPEVRIMNTEEKQLLSALFERVRIAATAPRDPEAEAFIASAVREQPYSPYLLAQAVLLQEQALKAADTRLHALESHIAALEQAKSPEPAPGFLGGLGASIFGGKTASGVPSVGTQPPVQPQPPTSVWGQPRQAQQPNYAPQPAYAPQPGYAPQAPAGGGFLQSAMTTAAGVAGGALLFQGVSSLFHSGGGYGGGFGGYGMGGGYGGQPVVNETIYETVNNNYAAPELAPSHSSSWVSSDPSPSDSSYQDASFDDNSFDSGSDDSGFA
jgi:hypothetical protein